MAADTVAVAVQPVDDRASFAIIEACNRALGEVRCALPGSPDAARSRARVALSSAAVERAAVAFELAGLIGPTRVLEFADSDPLEARYRAIGLVIAARILEEEAARSTPGAPPPAPPPRPLEPAIKRFGAETALFLGPGLDEGAWRWGLRARGLARPFARVPVSALLGVRLGVSAAGADEPTLRWTTFSLGAQGAVPLIRDALLLELHAEAALQFVHASLEDRRTGREDGGSQTRYGPLAGIQLAWTPFSFWALFLGAESALMWPELVIEVRRAEVAKEDPLRLSAHLGQRLSF